MEKRKNEKIKVSVVIPIYNVELYLRQCLESVANQTLKEIEIICVDDGSTDASPEIIREYAARDSRIKIISKDNSGYGNSMNRGFDAAIGEYIGIVESDDYAELNMFEVLYNIAHENRLDVVKSSYYFYYSQPKERNEKQEIVSKIMERKTFCPSSYSQAKMELVELFNMKPTIWSSIYRNEFIKENKIRFNETPGASFQDTSFNFKVLCMAQRMQMLRDAFIHYRQDNSNSSVNSSGKVFCVCDEYAEMQRFLNEHPDKKGQLEYIKNRIKYDSYMWNYNRLSNKYKYIFIERASSEFNEEMLVGKIDKDYFEWYKWNDLCAIIDDPIDWHTRKMLDTRKNYIESTRLDDAYIQINNIYNSPAYKIGKTILYLPYKVRGGVQCIKDHGAVYTFSYSLKKIAKIVHRRK